MPKVLFAGGKFNSVQTVGNVVDWNGATTFDGTYTDSSLDCTALVDTWLADFVGTTGAPASIIAGETGYAHVLVYRGSTSSLLAPIVELRDASNFPWISLRNTGTGTAGLFGNTGSGASPVWTQIGSNFPFTQGVLYNTDIKFTHSAPTIPVEFSINGSLVASGNFTQASLPALTRFAGQGGNNNAIYYSQIMVTEGISTINGKVRYRSATAAGASSGWTGTAGDINEVVNNDATIISAGAAALKSTFAMADVTLPVGFVIKSIFLWYRAKNDGVAPQNIKGVVRSGAVDYPMAANIPGMGTSFGPRLDRRDNDPATALPWTAAGWNAAEAGVQSET